MVVLCLAGDASASTLWDNDFWNILPGNADLSEPELLIAHYIHHMTPKVKIIVILRNPIDRWVRRCFFEFSFKIVYFSLFLAWFGLMAYQPL